MKSIRERVKRESVRERDSESVKERERDEINKERE